MNNMQVLANSVGVFLLRAVIILVVMAIILSGIIRATSFGNEKKIALSNITLAKALIVLVLVLFVANLAISLPSGFAGLPAYDFSNISSLFGNVKATPLAIPTPTPCEHFRFTFNGLEQCF